jgi:hypothetical protein
MELNAPGPCTRPCVVCGVDSSVVPETFPAATLLQASGATVLDFLVNFSLLDSSGETTSTSGSPLVDQKFICRPCLDVVVSCDQWGIALNNGVRFLRQKIAARQPAAVEPHFSTADDRADVFIKEEPSGVRMCDGRLGLV